MGLSQLVGLILDVGLGAVAFRLAVDLRKLVYAHDGRIAALEKLAKLKPALV